MQDKIDSYIRGEMTAAERSMFISELSSNSELRKEFELTRRIANSISYRAKKREQIQAWKKKRTSYKTIFMSSAITSIAAMFIVGFFLFRNTPNSSTFNTRENVVTSNRYTVYSEISMLIEKEDYTRALACIEKAESTSVNTDSSTGKQFMANNDSISTNLYELKWLKAQVLVGLDRIDEAKSLLNEIKSIEGKFHNDIDSLLNKLLITYQFGNSQNVK